MALKDLHLKGAYSSIKDNLLEDFYNPVLKQAISYDRTTGFFSPKVLAMAAKGFANLIKNGGHIRLLCSVKIDRPTIEAIKESQDNTLTDKIALDNIGETITKELEKRYLSVFSYLLQKGQLEMKIVYTNYDDGIFHEKIGIITDADGNRVSFSGSNNETVNGWRKNIEEFKVFESWEERDLDRIEIDEAQFNLFWNTRISDNFVTLPASEAIKHRIVQEWVPRPFTIEDFRIFETEEMDSNEDVAEIDEQDEAEAAQPMSTTEHEIPDRRPYQNEAISKWRDNGYCGIFEMATGTGKTLTALFGIQDFCKDNPENNIFVIAAPLKHLVEQWKSDVLSVFPEAEIITVNSDYPNWPYALSEDYRLYQKGMFDDRKLFIMTTYASMQGAKFQEIIQSYNDKPVCLISDEVHNVRTEKVLNGIKPFRYKLGLSATPRNEYNESEQGDPENKINQMIKEFGGIVYVFTLEQAIGKYLVQYEYHPVFVTLSSDEAEEYERLSRIISYNYDNQEEKENDITGILAKRAMIVKNAREKTDILPEILRKIREKNEHKYMLVYCDNKDQISDVQKILYDININSSKITFAETLQVRWECIKSFSQGYIDCLVARKCLDEGVNIPATQTAVLIASNTDQREYIQRLGRILRKYKDSETGIVKKKSVIYDFVCIPPSNDATRYQYLLRSEMRRMDFFSKTAINKNDVRRMLSEKEQEYNFKIEEFTNVADKS